MQPPPRDVVSPAGGPGDAEGALALGHPKEEADKDRAVVKVGNGVKGEAVPTPDPNDRSTWGDPHPDENCANCAK